ncbi:MAG TPA: hypothetical protein VK284_07580, partial [Streptosporangiaceae bacterium]|nr:hypothetical protein [Streptosporangiaceae bacterium]
HDSITALHRIFTCTDSADEVLEEDSREHPRCCSGHGHGQKPPDNVMVAEGQAAAARIGLGGVTDRITRPVTPPGKWVLLALRLGLEFLLLEFSFG